jgi:hypothetical protein
MTSPGLMAFLVLRIWFGKAVKDFNKAIQALGPVGPSLAANTGNAFTSESRLSLNRVFVVFTNSQSRAVVWVAYAFYAVPVIISLAKLNVVATKGY